MQQLYTHVSVLHPFLQMKDDFQHLEDDMGTLGARMAEITSSSNSINSALEERKKEISKLCGVNHLLKKVAKPI